MTKQLEIGQARLSCHSGRFVRIDYVIARGWFIQDFPSIFSAKAWCETNGLKIVG